MPGAWRKADPVSDSSTPEQDAPNTDKPGATRARRRGGKARSMLTELLVVVVGALVISSLLRAFIGQMFIIPSGSMENTLQVNDRVVVSKVSDYHRGDIVVFEDPANWLQEAPANPSPVRKAFELIGVLPSSSTNHLVKRVIGMPGDHVECCDAQGRISVNGKALDEAAYLYTSPDGTQARPSNFDFDVVVPAGRIFVMGDHRDMSGDSRCHLQDITNDGQVAGMAAFVPQSRVVGPVVAIAAPFDRWTRFHVPDTFSGIPEATGTAPDKPTVSVTNPDC